MDYKYKEFIKSLSSNLGTNPKAFWNFIKTKTKSKASPSILTEGNRDFTDSVTKANILNKFFHSLFSKDPNRPIPEIDVKYDPALSELTVDPDDVLKGLQALDTSKAIGPDGIPNKILKDFAPELAIPITTLFNISLSTGTLPSTWKTANVIPILKKEDPKQPNNNRPISLLPVISKVLERCIYNLIIPFLRPKITPNQYGFLSNRSIDTQMLSTFSDISIDFESKFQTDIIYFDLAKAFDSVPHDLLVLKLQTFGINGKLLNWFKDYLSNRYQRVVIDGAHSDWLTVDSGVPQGSILGPLQFILYNNDLPDVLTEQTKIGIFADDTKIYRCIKSIRDCLTLQHEINKITAWGKKWGLRFNLTKCNIITITSGLPKFMFPYKMADVVLKRVNEIVDLGVKVCSTLKWNKHIESIVKKAYQRIWLIIRTVGFDAPIKTKKILYITLVRSILEFGSTIWNPTSKGLMELIESIQRKATSLITNNPPRWRPNYKSYKHRLTECNLLPTSYRREITDIILFLRSLNTANGYECNKYLKFRIAGAGPTTRSQHHGLNIIVPNTKYAASAQFYPCRLAKLWNALPIKLREKLIHLDDKDKIKRVLIPYYFNRLNNIFDPNNTCTWVHACQCHRCSMA